MTTPMHTTPAIALAFLENNRPATPEMAVIQAVREGDDTSLDACSLLAALRVALHALDIVADVEGRNAFEDLIEASETITGCVASPAMGIDPHSYDPLNGHGR